MSTVLGISLGTVLGVLFLLGSTVVAAVVDKRAKAVSLQTDALGLLLLQPDVDGDPVRAAQKLVRRREYAAALEKLVALAPQATGGPATEVQAATGLATGGLATEAQAATGLATGGLATDAPPPPLPPGPLAMDAPPAPPLPLDTRGTATDALPTSATGDAAADPPSSQFMPLTLALLAAARADLKWQMGEHEQACALYRDALGVLDDHRAAMADLTAHVAARIGRHLYDTGALADAVPLLAKALDIKGDAWLLAATGSLESLRFLQKVLAPPFGGWTVAAHAPPVRKRPVNDRFLTTTVARIPGVKAVREWVFVPAHRADQTVRLVLVDAKKLNAWVLSPSGSVTQVLHNADKETKTKCSYRGFRWVIVRDWRYSLRAILGSPHYRLYCNGRSCEVRERVMTAGSGAGGWEFWVWSSGLGVGGWGLEVGVGADRPMTAGLGGGLGDGCVGGVSRTGRVNVLHMLIHPAADTTRPHLGTLQSGAPIAALRTETKPWHFFLRILAALLIQGVLIVGLAFVLIRVVVVFIDNTVAAILAGAAVGAGVVVLVELGLRAAFAYPVR